MVVRAMEPPRTTRKYSPMFNKRRPFLFFFIIFAILVLCHIMKLESKRSTLLSSNVLKIHDTSSIIVRRSAENSTIRQENRKTELLIENSVLFSDFVLVIVATNSKVKSLDNIAKNRIDCVYDTQLNDADYMKRNNTTVLHPMLSVDNQFDGGEPRWVVRCPWPPAKKAVVGLKVYEKDVGKFNWLVKMTKNRTVKSWNSMLAYEAVFDGEDTIAVFVKGLRLNGERKSDPGRFTCRFGKEFAVVTPAITAAQEIIRCSLPLGVTKSSMATSNEVVQVTIERGKISYTLPSIAKLHSSKSKIEDTKQGSSSKYELCACTMVWNQASFMKEWVTYHAWLGIQRWFVYDNNSDDGLNETINDLDSLNYNVSRHIWPWVKSQEAGFAHCLLRARDQCNWVTFIDVDEFYYLPSSKSKKNPSTNRPERNSLRAMVKNVSLSSPSIASIRANCYDFGPSGLKKSPIEGVTLGYTCRLRTYNRHKSIVRPDAVDDTLLNRIHHFELKQGFSGTTLPRKTAVINHYKYQVWDKFKAKFARRVSAYVPDWQDSASKRSNDRTPGLGAQAIEPPNWHQKFCQVWDTGLKDFIIENMADPSTKLLPWQIP